MFEELTHRLSESQGPDSPWTMAVGIIDTDSA